MQHPLRAFGAIVLISMGLSFPVEACSDVSSMAVTDVTYADVVVIGRISGYRIVRDMAFRKKMLSGGRLPPDQREFYRDPNRGLLSDYARFDIQVERVLAGRAPSRLTVTWDNSTFAEPPRMADGSYLVALRRASSRIPPLRGPSATIFPSPEPDRMTVLQAPCAPAFIVPAQSAQAIQIRNILARHRK